MSNSQFNAGAPTPPQGQGIDLEGQLQDAVLSFVQSQDPAIAVEIANTLAEMMGIAPGIDPYSDQQQSAPDQGGIPIYKSGGKLNDNPKGPSKGTTSTLTPERTVKRTVFQPQDLATGTIQNRSTTPQMGKAIGERPTKTQKRIRVQSAGLAGQDIAQAGGYRIGNNAAYDEGANKGELAGQFSDLEFKIPAVEHTLPPLDFGFNLDVPTSTPTDNGNLNPTSASEIRQRYGEEPKRRLPRVGYLQGHGYGRNKRSESGY
jgi:hypothetical protein